MQHRLNALRSSVTRLGQLVESVDDAALEAPAYPSEWTIADVLSHVGSGAVILQRRLEDSLSGQPTPDDFAPQVWATWNAKAPRDQANDASDADRQLLRRLESLTDAERSAFTFSIGPLSFDIAGFVGLRLNEHAFHTWDVEVATNPAATIPPDATELVIDNLELVARFTAKPTGQTTSLRVATIDPARLFTIELTPEGVIMSTGTLEGPSDLQLPAEAFCRLVYGRLDPDHTPQLEGDTAVLDVLRRAFPGP